MHDTFRDRSIKLYYCLSPVEKIDYFVGMDSYSKRDFILSEFDLHKILRIFVIAFAIVTPIHFGYWRYLETSNRNKIADGILWCLLSGPFSLGLILSLTQIGRKIRYITLFILTVGFLAHLIFVIFPLVFIPLLLVANSYAVYALCRKMKR